MGHHTIPVLVILLLDGCIVLTSSISGIPRSSSTQDVLYPYGPSLDMINPKSDDRGSQSIPLSTEIPLFGSPYTSLYVNNNGLLSFRFPVEQYTPQDLPIAFGNPLLAPFWADVDNTVAGNIYYRNSTEPGLLNQTTSDVNTYFQDLNFTAQWVFVATWANVTYYGSASDTKVNTFQAVLTTGGNHTFILFNYKDIQWTAGLASDGGGSAGALAGLNSGYDAGYLKIQGSLSPAIVNISTTSNVNVTGRWVFKVDKLHPEDVNGHLVDSVGATNILKNPDFTTTTQPTTPYVPPIFGNDPLYPYGPEIDHYGVIDDDDGYGQPTTNNCTFTLFGEVYNDSYFYVNTNGFLSVKDSFTQFIPQKLPVTNGIPFLAPFWADVDTMITGNIYYRLSNDSELLNQSTSDIRIYFCDLNFTAEWVFVATWDNVTYFGSVSDKVNTFQAVVSTDGNLTFVLFNYGNIEWASTDSGYRGPMALAGLNSGYNNSYFTIPGSLSSAMINISSTSNVDFKGRWAFRVDSLYPEDMKRALDNSHGNQNENKTPIFENDLLYPFGVPIDTVNSKSSNSSLPAIPLSTDISLFGNIYSSLYVKNNGLLSVSLNFTYSEPQDLPVLNSGPFLAPFWVYDYNVKGGYIYYRQSTEQGLLNRTTADIRTYFRDLNFTAQWALVATWDRVASESLNKVNTFQSVLTTDGLLTFVIFNYEDIQWDNEFNYYRVLAGLNSGNITGYYKIPDSLSPAIVNICSSSNVNVNGRWVFRVDKLHPEDVNGKIELLYPYGSENDTTTPKSDDGGSELIPLGKDFPLFGKNVSSLYVNNNGLLSFGSSVNHYIPQDLPVAYGNPFIAPFWADVDNTKGGDIFYRQSTDPELLSWVSSNIRSYFHPPNYNAERVFVSTWHRVIPYGPLHDQMNTFQAALSTDGNFTYIIFNYKEIQWTASTVNYMEDTVGNPALAGLNSGYNTGHYKLPGSLSPDILNIVKTSNVNFPGRWAFRVDKPYPEDVNGNIDLSINKSIIQSTTSTQNTSPFSTANEVYSSVTKTSVNSTTGKSSAPAVVTKGVTGICVVTLCTFLFVIL